jgi:hypothetical protein
MFRKRLDMQQIIVYVKLYVMLLDLELLLVYSTIQETEYHMQYSHVQTAECLRSCIW